MNSERRRVAQAGFTLAELMVVFAIIGLLAGIVVFAVVGALDKASWQQAVVQTKSFAKVVRAFKMDCKRFPKQEEGLDVDEILGAGHQHWILACLMAREEAEKGKT